MEKLTSHTNTHTCTSNQAHWSSCYLVTVTWRNIKKKMMNSWTRSSAMSFPPVTAEVCVHFCCFGVFLLVETTGKGFPWATSRGSSGGPWTVIAFPAPSQTHAYIKKYICILFHFGIWQNKAHKKITLPRISNT